MSRHAEAAFSSITRGEGFCAQPVSTDAKTGRVPPPSPSPRGEGVAAGDGRGVVPICSPLRTAQKRNEDHLSRHPACGRRRMPPSPPGEGFYAQPVPMGAKPGRVPLPSPSPRGEGVAAGDGRGVVPDRSFFRRTRKRNKYHLFRHPACGRRRMPPSPQGEGFYASICSRFLTNRAALLPRSAGLNCC